MNTVSTGKQTSTGAGWVNILLGTRVVVSPFLLGFSRDTAAMWNNIAVGAAVVLLALVSGRVNETVPALIVPLGMWLFASPFVLGFSSTAFLSNNLIMAFGVIAGGLIREGLRPKDSPGITARG
ncbi:conserved membrane hypothetical protein [Verrucomicrobia bacterium]|nr:conserved membrane hypothetical protein [Verrucomicrobiota bacterium]